MLTHKAHKEIALIENKILSALPLFEYKQIIDNLELVKISRGEVLFDVYEKLECIFFPTSAVISILSCLRDGTTVEITTIGNEGLVDISSFFGVSKSSTQAIVSHTGEAYRITLKLFQACLSRSGGRREGLFQKAITRYAASLFIQTSQAVACNRRHSIEQQLCTWLLINFDRLNTDTLVITQEAIGYYLGVRRETITEAAKRLQNLGLISCKRGEISLMNRLEMENNACECYEIISEETISHHCAA